MPINELPIVPVELDSPPLSTALSHPSPCTAVSNSISHKTIRTLVWSHSLLFELSITIVRDLNRCIAVISKKSISLSLTLIN